MSSSDAWKGLPPPPVRKAKAKPDPMAQLIQALREQTEAIHFLAASNESLVRAMLGQDEGDDPDEPTTYLNGQAIGH